ncbi:hypothetical protein KUTeg_024268 [Tegillarca granosa]|uniref:CID domain-containing protein n=1 Tax=Tegillarca granosa TaxID=220873 RepID=A0ABQ9E1E9_TEGGR|nr:hypothetical protein KUTeg_024268 [Tegillarca granosa]
MEDEVIEEYRSSLKDLTQNSKPLINMLTMLAEDNEHFAPQIVQVIETHLNQVPPNKKLPTMYLIDSIIKNLPKSTYASLFSHNIVSTFCGVFEKVDEKTRQALFKLRQTWGDMFQNRKLYAIDVRVNLLDPAWPITAQAPTEGSIHVNPLFLQAKKEEEDAAAAELFAQEEAESTMEIVNTNPSLSASGLPLPPVIETPLPNDPEEQEALMRQQLIAKQQELLKLQQQRLELELAETRAKLEQQKQLNKDPSSINTTATSLSMSAAVPPASSVASLPPTNAKQSNNQPPSSRDPRSAGRLTTRDPRLANKPPPPGMLLPKEPPHPVGNVPIPQVEKLEPDNVVPQLADNFPHMSLNAIVPPGPPTSSPMPQIPPNFPPQNIIPPGPPMNILPPGAIPPHSVTEGILPPLQGQFVPIQVMPHPVPAFPHPSNLLANQNNQALPNQGPSTERTNNLGMSDVPVDVRNIPPPSSAPKNKPRDNTHARRDPRFAAQRNKHNDNRKKGNEKNVPDTKRDVDSKDKPKDSTKNQSVVPTSSSSASNRRNSPRYSKGGGSSSSRDSKSKQEDDDSRRRKRRDSDEDSRHSNSSDDRRRDAGRSSRSTRSNRDRNWDQDDDRRKRRSRDNSPRRSRDRSPLKSRSPVDKGRGRGRNNSRRPRNTPELQSASLSDKNSVQLKSETPEAGSSKTEETKTAQSDIKKQALSQVKREPGDEMEAYKIPKLSNKKKTEKEVKKDTLKKDDGDDKNNKSSISDKDDKGQKTESDNSKNTKGTKRQDAASKDQDERKLNDKKDIQKNVENLDKDERSSKVPSKREIDQQGCEADQYDQEGPSTSKKPRLEENLQDTKESSALQEDLCDLFGQEDKDYRSMMDVDRRAYPLKSPSHAGWSKYKSDHSHDFSYDIEAQKKRESVVEDVDHRQIKDIDQRSNQSLQDVDLRASLPKPVLRSPNDPRLNRDPYHAGPNPEISPSEKVNIPTALSIDNREEILHQIEKRRLSGELSYEMQKELLLQLTRLDLIQKQQAELKKMQEKAALEEELVNSPHKKPIGSPKGIAEEDKDRPLGYSERLPPVLHQGLDPHIPSDRVLGPHGPPDRYQHSLSGPRMNDHRALLDRQPGLPGPSRGIRGPYKESDRFKAPHNRTPVPDTSSGAQDSVVPRGPPGPASSVEPSYVERTPRDYLDDRPPRDIDNRLLRDVDNRLHRDFPDDRPGRDFPYERPPRDFLNEREPPLNRYDDRHGRGRNYQYEEDRNFRRGSPRDDFNDREQGRRSQKDRDRPRYGDRRDKDREEFTLRDRYGNENRHRIYEDDKDHRQNIRDGPLDHRRDNDPRGNRQFRQGSPVKVDRDQKNKHAPMKNIGDPRWQLLSSRPPDQQEEFVIDGKPYNIQIGQPPKRIPLDGKFIEVFADPNLRAITIDGNVVYKFGDSVRDFKFINKHKVFYHGLPKSVWIDGTLHEIRVDAPPKFFSVGDKKKTIKIDGRDNMIIIDKTEYGPCGGPPRFVFIDDLRCELRFDPPPRHILIDGKLCELKLDRAVPCIIIDGKPHAIRFDGPPRNIIVNDTVYKVPMDKPIKIKIYSRPHFLAFGGPAHEVIFDGKWYEVKFNGPAKDIIVGQRKISVRLEGNPPEVKILEEIDEKHLPSLIDMPIGQPGKMAPVLPGQGIVRPNMPPGERMMHPNVPQGERMMGPNMLQGEMMHPIPSGEMIGPQDQTGFRGPVGGPMLQPPNPRMMDPRFLNSQHVRPDMMHLGPQGQRMGLDLMHQQPNQGQMMPHGQMMPQDQQGMMGMGNMMRPNENVPQVGFGMGMQVPSTMPMQQQPSSGPVDVNSLLQSLLKAGIISKPAEEKEKKEEEESVDEEENSKQKEIQRMLAYKQTKIEEVPDISNFNTNKLKKHYKGVIQKLYAGIQCASCGTRFTGMQTEKYKEHLDWHFRQNKRDKEGTNVAKVRKWYYEIKDWIQYEEIDESDERIQCLRRLMSPAASTQEPVFSIPSGPEITQCPAATGDDEGDVCVICGDPFEQFWDEEAEEWHLRDAIRSDKKTYHPVCYEDAREEGSIADPTPTPTPATAPTVNPLIAAIRQELGEPVGGKIAGVVTVQTGPVRLDIDSDEAEVPTEEEQEQKESADLNKNIKQEPVVKSEPDATSSVTVKTEPSDGVTVKQEPLSQTDVTVKSEIDTSSSLNSQIPPMSQVKTEPS